MVLTLQLLSAFLIGIGAVFTLIDFRTRFGPQLRYFSVCLVVMPGVVLLDLFSMVEWTEVETKAILQRLMHLAVLPFIVFSTAFLPKITGNSRSRAYVLFAAGGIILSPLVLTDWFLEIDGDRVIGGPAYAFTFLPFGTLYVAYAYAVQIRHVLGSPPGNRRFPILHLMSFATVTAGGMMDMVAVAAPDLLLFPSCKSLGILGFGVFCVYFFAEQFLQILRDRNELFRKVEELDRDILNSKPLRDIGESTARISHEIRNYLAVLKSNHALLKSRMPEASESPEVDRMFRSTERLETFTRSLLQYSNCSQSTIRLPLDLPLLLRDCIDTHFPGKSETFMISGRETRILVRGDRSRLEQAFLNLFRNSLEAGAAKVAVELDCGKGYVTVRIRDDGSGCPESDIACLGTPFFTTKKESGGTGLGLAIATSIIHGHGGRLELFPSGFGSAGHGGFDLLIVLPDLPIGKMSAAGEATASERAPIKKGPASD